MLFLKKLFQTPPLQAEGRALYRRIAERARWPVFYTFHGVPDTIDGRFEMLSLHAYAVFHALKGRSSDAQNLSQAIYDAMFDDLDGSLRELGVADLGVGRRIKTMTEALNGRIQAYDGASSAGGDALERAIRRNVYGTAAASDEQVRAMADYLRGIRAACDGAAFRDFCDGSVMDRLPEPPAVPESPHRTG